MTLKEAARFLKLSVATLNRVMREGKLPSYKIGGRRLFDKAELIEWVKKHKSSFGAQADGSGGQFFNRYIFQEGL
jgi:excisionase family DNA binding protein